LSHSRVSNLLIIFILLNLCSAASAIENVNCRPETDIPEGKWNWYSEINVDYYFEFIETAGQTVRIYSPSKAACESRAESINVGTTLRLCDCQPGFSLTVILGGTVFPGYSLVCRNFDLQGKMINSSQVATFLKPDTSERSTCLERAKTLESSTGFIGK
jgi:hypothetical protein